MPLENAARAAYDLKRFRDAALLYEQLLRLAPNRADLWKTDGRHLLYELEDRPAALRCFRRALLLESDPGERAKLEALVKELEDGEDFGFGCRILDCQLLKDFLRKVSLFADLDDGQLDRLAA